MRQKLVRTLGSAAVVAALLAVSACTDAGGGGDASGGSKCGLKIAFFGALTGDNANLGINIRDGAQLAIDQYNKENADCKVILENKDSQGSETQAPGIASQIVQDQKIIGVVGPAFSGESEAANGTLDKGGVTIITASATKPALSEKGWKTFHRALGNDATQGPAVAKYIKDTLKSQKVFLIDDTTAYGKGLVDQVKKDLGAAVVGSDTVQPKQTQFSATVTKVIAAKPDALFYSGYYAEGSLFVKQLRAAGYTGKIIVPDGVKDPAFIDTAGQAAEGTIVTCPCVPPEKATGDFNFAEEYNKAFKREAGTYSAEAFDAANIFLAGIKAGKTTRKDMEAFVDAYEGQGITKKFKFTDAGEPDPSSIEIWAYEVKGGKIVANQIIK